MPVRKEPGHWSADVRKVTEVQMGGLKQAAAFF